LAWKQDIEGFVTGARLVSAMTGDLSSARELAAIIALGEVKYGEYLAEQYKQELPLVEDEEVVNYVDSIGQKVAKKLGRQQDSVGNPIKYEFYVIDAPNTNAFALAGGKIFLYSGLLEILNSEAELAGILAHEAAHAALSHSIEEKIEFTTAQNISKLIPFGSFLTDLQQAKYNRHQERDADILGTRALTEAGYAADGLHRVMKTFNKLGSSGPTWSASHPPTDKRIKYLQDLIQRRNYNRYQYEGVQPYWQEKNILRENLRFSLASLDPEDVEEDSGGGGLLGKIGDAISDAVSFGGDDDLEIPTPSDGLIQLANLQQAATLTQQEADASEESETQADSQTEDTESQQATADSSNTSSESETADATAGTNSTVEGDALVSESQEGNATNESSDGAEEAPTPQENTADNDQQTAQGTSQGTQQIPFENFWQEKQGVVLQLLHANVKPWGRYTLDIKVENHSEEKFGIGPFAVDILTYEREEIPSDFKVKEGNAIVEPGDTLIATVKVIGQKWQTNEGKQEETENQQGLVLSIRESTPAGRVFRIGF
jgi:hypothetical protein